MRSFLVAVVGIFAATACKSTPKEAPPPSTAAYNATSGGHALATLGPASGSSVHGAADFVENAGKVTLTVQLTGLSQGTHAIHIHENGDCRAADASSAGAHWNPGGAPHGKLDGAPSHLGDIGNFDVGADTNGSLSFTTDKWTIGTGQPNDIVGKAVIVHANKDDFVSQPAGNAGGRVVCGVIQIQK